jgi:hypothetical protein
MRPNVPEPATLLLFGFGLSGFLALPKKIFGVRSTEGEISP